MKINVVLMDLKSESTDIRLERVDSRPERLI